MDWLHMEFQKWRRVSHRGPIHMMGHYETQVTSMSVLDRSVATKRVELQKVKTRQTTGTMQDAPVKHTAVDGDTARCSWGNSMQGQLGRRAAWKNTQLGQSVFAAIYVGDQNYAELICLNQLAYQQESGNHQPIVPLLRANCCVLLGSINISIRQHPSLKDSVIWFPPTFSRLATSLHQIISINSHLYHLIFIIISFHINISTLDISGLHGQ